MKNKHSSIDGFMPRRSGNKLGELHGDSSEALFDAAENKQLHTTGEGENMRVLGQSGMGYGLGRSDISESLQGIDDIKAPAKKKLSRRQRRLEKRSIKKPKSLARRIIKRLIIVVLLVGLLIGGYTVYNLMYAGNSIFQGNIFEVFSNQPLKQDSNGRSNFLILGTSEDDPGHEGGNLTDSILIVSIDQTNKDTYMFSVPRDLYVNYGVGCYAGYYGKINAYFGCINTDTAPADEQDRLEKTQKFIGDIFGIDIQYGVHINHAVIKQAVDAVGGVDVDIKGSDGASGVLDRNFDWRCKYTCFLVKYDNGVHHLDGEHALYLAQARGDVAPTYGLANSNFDREVNQQKILIALKDKATSAGILTNLSAVTKLINALGDNLRTNIQTNEIRTLAQVAGEIKTSSIHTISLLGDYPVVTTDNINGASVVVPSAGTFDYSEIVKLISKSLTSDPVEREAAPVVVLNGTDQAGVAQTEADKLTSKGFNISLVDNAPDTNYTKTEIYQIGTGNSATATKLASLYGVSINKTTPPVLVNGDVRFVVVIGVATS
jgi:LCP family protein required for cell wall assembly